MRNLKKFNNVIDLQRYMNANFITPHVYLDTTSKNIDYYEGYENLEYISSTKTGGQYIDLGCHLFENTDDIIIDIKFNLKGGGKDYDESNSVNKTKPSVLIACVSESDPYFGFVVRKADIGSTGTVDDTYVTMYTKWQISNSVYKNANGDSNGKNKYYPTYLAGNTFGYENTRTGVIYEKRLIIDNLSTIESSTFNKMKNLEAYMFATYHDGPTTGNAITQWTGKMWRFSESDVYYCKIMKGDTIIRDLKPARRKKDNVVGLLDIEHRVFYPSLGNTGFIGGPAI